MTIEDIASIVSMQLGRRMVSAEDRMVEDLGAESVDVVNIIARIEERYGVTIEEQDLPDLVTVRDLHRYAARKREKG